MLGASCSDLCDRGQCLWDLSPVARHTGVLSSLGRASSPFPGSSRQSVLPSACYYCCKTKTRRWKSSSRKYNVRRYHPRRSLLRMGWESAFSQVVGRVRSRIAELGSNPGSVTFSVSPKAQAKTASELSKSMETMRGHLQAQLRCKEAENSRLCMQIKVPAWPRR